MIISSPTGLYKSVLPAEEESGNITFIISSTDPPRPLIRAVQLPVAEEFKQAPDKIHTDEQRRAQVGELVFTIAGGNRSLPGSNTKIFEVGEILRFEELVPVEEISTIRAPQNIEIRHDTNLLDLEAVGLDANEIDEVIKLSREKQSELETEFVRKREEIENLDVEIIENQKSINETDKTSRAIAELFESSSEEIVVKLENSLETLKARRDELIDARNVAGSELEEIYQSVVRISELVR